MKDQESKDSVTEKNKASPQQQAVLGFFAALVSCYMLYGFTQLPAQEYLTVNGQVFRKSDSDYGHGLMMARIICGCLTTMFGFISAVIFHGILADWRTSKTD